MKGSPGILGSFCGGTRITGDTSKTTTYGRLLGHTEVFQDYNIGGLTGTICVCTFVTLGILAMEVALVTGHVRDGRRKIEKAPVGPPLYGLNKPFHIRNI